MNDKDKMKKKINLPEIKSNKSISKKKSENKEKKKVNYLDLAGKRDISKIINNEKNNRKSLSDQINQGNNSLDLVLMGDLTGSMAAYHSLLKTQFEKLSNDLMHMIPGIRIAIIFYLDHGSGDPYITRVQDLTDDTQSLVSFIRETSTGCGGDAHEAVEDALNDALNLSWRAKVNRSIVIFGDAAAHEPNRCPYQYSYFDIVKSLFEKMNVTINAVYCGGRHYEYNNMLSNIYPVEIADFTHIVKNLDHPKFFSWIANVTGGMIISVRNIYDLLDIIKTSAAKDTGKLDDLEKEFSSKYDGSTRKSKLNLVDIARKSISKKINYLNKHHRKLLS